MATNDYAFLTEWHVPAPPDVVFDIISDVEGYPRWWPEVYLAVDVERPPEGGHSGTRAHLLTKGKLPYRLRWTAETIRSDPPRALEIRATGDFDGHGVWTLEPHAGGTCVRFDWRLRAEKPLLRTLSFALKPLFSWNHRWAMARGFEGIVEEAGERTLAGTLERSAGVRERARTHGSHG